MLKKFFFLISFLILAAGGILASAYLKLVVYHPGDEISQESIRKILAMESPVYYQDGENKIGVFFQDAHRQYVTFEEIPKDFVNAIVAAEDNSFFHHFGADIPGILRALLTNIKAGRVVQGGSTITQQTAKNLFKRQDRSLKSKLKELLYALRLEYHYPKEKILEFYANQFFVSGNGHGLGVAAQYYFDKPVAELDLLECAFIAGSVKRPNFYNPFIKRDAESIAIAKKRARQRTQYVLDQMAQLGMLEAGQYDQQLTREIEFHQGRMFYSLNTLMDQVKEALDLPEVEEALVEQGIDNVSTSGIRIFTTIEKPLQDQAVTALRAELSRLDIRLRGYEPAEVQQEYRNHTFFDDHPPNAGAFLFGEIAGIDPAGPAIRVNLGKLGGKLLGQGIIDRQGMEPFLKALTKWRHQRWSEPGQADRADLLTRFKTGDRVYASIRSIDSQSGQVLLNLEKFPKLQGALLAIKEGTIRAMVGGMENFYYNRAIAAKRPMGSVIKPLVYAAALQLGWNSLDPLVNERDLFIYQNQAYFPRPDHDSPHAAISMNWAGVNSENVATVWLLYHLCDKLSPAQFKELLENTGLERQTIESQAQYQTRLRDRHGIVVNRDTLSLAAFNRAVDEIEPDLIFAGRLDEYSLLKRMHYGTDFDRFNEEVEAMRLLPEYGESRSSRLRIEQEIKVRSQILANNFLRFRKLREQLHRIRMTGSPLEITDTFEAAPGANPEQPLGNLYYDREADRYNYASREPEGDNWQLFSPTAFQQLPATDFSWETVLIDGILAAGTIDQMEAIIRTEYEELASQAPYSFDVLASLPDFRVMAGLHYLIDLARQLDIASDLEPVLSFPLGSNVISLLEAAQSYEGLITGRVVTSGRGESRWPLTIIDRIEDIDGNQIYTAPRRTRQVFAPKTTVAVAGILRNVVLYGTGEYAEQNVALHTRSPEKAEQLALLDISFPLLGKTGTSNRFTNSAYVGFVPAVDSNNNQLALEGGYTVAAYVGFDDNTPMEHRTTHITGSQGALPAWTRMVNALLLEKGYADSLDLIDLAFAIDPQTGKHRLDLHLPELGQINIPVDRDTGLPLDNAGDISASSRQPTVTTFGRLLNSGELEPTRDFLPFWLFTR